MRGKVDCFGISETGCVRETNQDQFLIADLRKSIVIHHSSLGYDEATEFSGASRAKLFVVADGMGGHHGGERASMMAVEGVIQYMLTNLHWPIRCAADHEEQFFRSLHSALEFSQSQIRCAADLYPAQCRMGTTFTMAWVVWPSMYLIHVGDSRAYLYRDDQLQLLSHDQTLAQALADSGVIGAADVDHHQFRSVLVSALGCTENMEPQYSRHELQLNDQLLICSDGLTNHLEDSEIADVLSSAASAEKSCRLLVDLANDAGGTDNITTVVARFLEQESVADEAAVAKADKETEFVF